MKSILGRGILITFSLGILGFIIYYLVDQLAKVWRPVIMALFDRSYLVVPLAIVFTLMVVVIVGYLFSPRRLSPRASMFFSHIPVLNWFMGDRHIPQSADDLPGALVRFSDGAYFIGALVGEQKFRDKDGKVDILYKIYSPSAPVPWSGLPIIFVQREKVILLKINFGEVYGITTSFGRNTREIMDELNLNHEEETGTPLPELDIGPIREVERSV